DKLMEEVKHTFKPEFLNRIDDIIVFRPLLREDLVQIVDLELNFVKERLKEQKIDLVVSAEAKDFISEKGFDPVFGARPLKRTIQRYLEDPLAKEIISGRFKEGSMAKVGHKSGDPELNFE
ncbi:MAG: hypothetical protein WC478_06570, partial [Candidatus Omnitrophota bacterium]